MRLRLPSPSTAIASLALFVSLGGTSLAAVNFAKRAGKVDGKSAVSASASLAKAGGKLVATGSDGRLPSKFVDGTSRGDTFGSYVPVTDNATGALVSLAGESRVGTLSATCTDENPAAGVKNPSTTVTFTNTTAGTINYAARLGITNPPTVVAQAPSTTQSLTIRGSNTFAIQAAVDGIDVRFDGTVRQDGPDTADAKCLVYGTMTRVID